jgi:ribosomal protein S18 acetylase RimI-like enzyme
MPGAKVSRTRTTRSDFGQRRSAPERTLLAMDEPLDNPTWHALAELSGDLVIRSTNVARFVPEAAPFFGMERDTPQAYAEARRLLGASPDARFFLATDRAPPDGWRETFKKPIAQMVLPPDTALPASSAGMHELGPGDVPAMLDLAAQGKPGPFGPRTRELGTYLGIREDNRLVAMAGERLRFAGHAEISAVTTHPDYRGRGHGRALTVALARRIRDGGRVPFLHVYPDNPAAELYRSIGFVDRVKLLVVWLAPT